MHPVPAWARIEPEAPEEEKLLPPRVVPENSPPYRTTEHATYSSSLPFLPPLRRFFSKPPNLAVDAEPRQMLRWQLGKAPPGPEVHETSTGGVGGSGTRPLLLVMMRLTHCRREEIATPAPLKHAHQHAVTLHGASCRSQLLARFSRGSLGNLNFTAVIGNWWNAVKSWNHDHYHFNVDTEFVV